MKCWKCGQEIPDGSKNCVYCSVSQERSAPSSDAGKAMRMLYDHYGAQKLFTEPAYLANGLGDLLPGSQKLRGQLKMALDAGIGRLYLEQLRGKGSPDDDFRRRVRTLLIEDAEISEKAATALTGYLDEMIGWQRKTGSPVFSYGSADDLTAGKGAQSVSSKAAGKQTASGKQSSSDNQDASRKQTAASAAPKAASAGTSFSYMAYPSVAFPAEGVPSPGVSVGMMTLGLIGGASLMGFGIALSGMALLLIPVGLGIAFITFFLPMIRITLYSPWNVQMTRNGSIVECRLKTTNRGLHSNWFAAVNGQWVLSGTGASLLLRDAAGTPLPGRQLVFLLQNVPAGADVHLCAQDIPGGKLQFVCGRKVF